ncbi:MAG: DUF2059 domain-containing protein [Oceanicaulis sp.]
MSLDRMKALMLAGALLSALTACEADAHIATGSSEAENNLHREDSAGPVLFFEDLPEAERNARLALGAEVMRLTAPGDFPELVRENISQSILLTIPMNHPGVTEEQMEEATALVPEYYERYEDSVAERISAIYASLYTVEELEALIAFFSSEIGMKFKAQASEVDARITQVLVDTIGSMETDIMRIVRPESYGMEPRTRTGTSEGEAVIDPGAAADDLGDAPDPDADPNE